MLLKNFFKGLLFSAAMIMSGEVVSAASGNIDREDRIVYITGDDWRDQCYVTVDGDEIEIELTVYDAGGDVDDTDDRDYDLEDIDLIVFHGFSGDDDFWNNTPIPSVAYGGAGDDVLLGGSADDDLYGGAGGDYLAGGSGNDDLFGGRDADYLYGGPQQDYLKAGTGEDEWVIAGQSGADIFAVPKLRDWRTNQYIRLDRSVYYEDFDAQVDTQEFFRVTVFGTFSTIWK
jgi:Ca2+-binding RTX toxin-like protein